MIDVMNQTIKSFGYPDTLIKEYEHWVVLLRPNQVTIGSLIVVAKSEATHLGQLSPEEWSEFSLVASYAEKLLRDAFGAEKFNYLALMMKDPNVHFHLIPRYSSPITINNRTYKDVDWPLKTELNALVMPDEDLVTIKELLIK